MNTDAKLNAALGRKTGIALDETGLSFDRAPHTVDDAAELDEAAVASALNDAPVMGVDGRIDQIAAQPAQPRQGTIFVRCGETAVADNIRD